ncbi:DUF2529 domain-containing protein [Lysinibacillus agricola]|uniref:DUF2529 domain-containing protein n=1 Tax=Lysinibacillus agricola TaxID=2590012 RepID=A0ABX7AW89_9BACI|nr:MULTISPECIES: DUF2529 family protein [Lysinibacillus]KOS60828.1 hypothetical protein AN161_22085 [Lysinibacillus sp. FJAT-14222]QQP13143.1 DUF2529 domain-containing protein [Lysinibacillus agricola]
MSKILTTQLSGLLQRITQNEEEAIEETARLLAQAGIGEGNVYFACFGEMQVVELNACQAVERFAKLVPWTKDTVITEADRVCIFTRGAHDEEALALAHQLNNHFIPFAAVASEVADSENPLADLAYTYISTRIRGGLLPNDLGERIVVPHSIAALFVYEAVKIAYDEMLALDDEEL